MARILQPALILAIIGTILVVAEALAPGAHLVVLGVALLGAGVTGLLLEVRSFLFLGAFALVYGSITFYYYRNLSFVKGDERGERTTDSNKLVGRIGRVTETVTEETGEVKVEGSFDPFYVARSTGGEIPVGTKVRVVDPRGGNVLEVEPLDDEEGSEEERQE